MEHSVLGQDVSRLVNGTQARALKAAERPTDRNQRHTAVLQLVLARVEVLFIDDDELALLGVGCLNAYGFHGGSYRGGTTDDPA